ncbi:hypothetical protein B0T24DRAFT_683586 [Lasiosphaeria ovina]|uniref:NWD NACHT-NTPase N-terminal domain-containing protein n=1 Tax=Lasiosphaeria ovina TaxID=92902 RepID=A0AAE0MZR5_9PEZI|nr:hypothetical protein B0T24DRAFT_683586 [Lasiosphaeria ovina]
MALFTAVDRYPGSVAAPLPGGAYAIILLLLATASCLNAAVGDIGISKASRITTGVGEVAGFILSAKGMVNLVLQSVPQAAPAALPWAGVCLGLQMLRNPAQATISNPAAIAYVISGMDWYYALTKHLLNKSNIIAGNEFQAILHRLEETVVKLYKAILFYQMKSVYSYYRNQGLVFLRGMLGLDDWDGDLKLVTDVEATIKKDAAQYYQERTKTFSRRACFISSQKDARRDDIEAACRRDIYIVDPQYNIERIEKNKDELLDDAYKRILRTPENALYALSEASRNMARDPRLSPVYFAVDALDECGQGLSDPIQLISTSLTLSEKVRWSVSSRPTVKLNNPDTTRMLLELDAQTLERPVSVYIDHKLAAFRGRDGYDENTLAIIPTTIREGAKNTFV